MLSAALLAGCGGTSTSTKTVTVPAKNARAITSVTETSTRPAAILSTARRTTTTHPVRTRAKPLAGKTVGVDPGHNGGNAKDPSYINHQIWNGRQMEACNTTGTATDSGYTEAQFNWNVATFLAAKLRAQGARVVLTRHNNSGVGPCVNQRAAIMNAAHANVAVAIHADGGPAGGRGFAVLVPVKDSENAASVSASARFGTLLRDDFGALTGMPTSTYDGRDGLVARDDLGGLNLTRVPNVLIETGNMRNSTDTGLLTSSAWQQKAAGALDRAIVKFLS